MDLAAAVVVAVVVVVVVTCLREDVAFHPHLVRVAALRSFAAECVPESGPFTL